MQRHGRDMQPSRKHRASATSTHTHTHTYTHTHHERTHTHTTSAHTHTDRALSLTSQALFLVLNKGKMLPSLETPVGLVWARASASSSASSSSRPPPPPRRLLHISGSSRLHLGSISAHLGMSRLHLAPTSTPPRPHLGPSGALLPRLPHRHHPVVAKSLRRGGRHLGLRHGPLRPSPRRGL